jgi:transposase-like protein
LFIHEIKERLRTEGVCGDISNATIARALRRMDGRKLIMLMREKASKQLPDAFMEAGYLIERLFGIIDDLLAKVPTEVKEKIGKQHLYEHLRRCFGRSMRQRKGPGERDTYCPRKKLERDRKRNCGFLKQLLTGVFPSERCPDCHSGEIRFVFNRPRWYRNAKGERVRDYSRVYRCLNRECGTVYFTRPPKGVELYARVHRDVKLMVLRWVFHLRGSLSRVCDELADHGIKVALTTVLRWVKKAGEECVDALHVCEREDWEQPLCIDEKWIKVRSRWSYVFTAVGEEVTDVADLELYYHKNHQAMKSFLLGLKARGFRPKSITTDLLLGYENVVKEVFPECAYQQCVLHAERDAKRIVRQSLPGEADGEWKEKLVKAIRTLFRSRKLKQVKKRYAHFLKLKASAPVEVSAVFDMLEKYYPKLCQAVSRTDIPRTTNPAERAIGEFEERYQLTKGFTSFYYAQFFIKAYQVYYRMRKISFGPFRGRSRLELKGNPLGGLHFTDYLTPIFP